MEPGRRLARAPPRFFESKRESHALPVTRLAISIVAFALLAAARRRRPLSMEFANDGGMPEGKARHQHGIAGWSRWKVLLVLFFFGFVLPWAVMVVGLLTMIVWDALFGLH